jgi:hypothetical protein
MPTGSLLFRRDVLPRCKGIQCSARGWSRNLTISYFIIKVFRHLPRNVGIAHPLSELTQRLVWIAVRLLRIGRGLREINWVVMLVFYPISINNVEIFFCPKFSPMNSYAYIRNEFSSQDRPLSRLTQRATSQGEDQRQDPPLVAVRVTTPSSQA